VAEVILKIGISGQTSIDGRSSTLVWRLIRPVRWNNSNQVEQLQEENSRLKAVAKWSKICAVFGTIPLRVGKKECVLPNVIR
jgi:hypothetical protein